MPFSTVLPSIFRVHVFERGTPCPFKDTQQQQQNKLIEIPSKTIVREVRSNTSLAMELFSIILFVLHSACVVPRQIPSIPSVSVFDPKT